MEHKYYCAVIVNEHDRKPRNCLFKSVFPPLWVVGSYSSGMWATQRFILLNFWEISEEHYLQFPSEMRDFAESTWQRRNEAL